MSRNVVLKPPCTCMLLSLLFVLIVEGDDPERQMFRHIVFNPILFFAQINFVG